MRRLAVAVWLLVVVVYIGDVVLLYATQTLDPTEPPPLLQAAEDFAFVLAATLALVVLRRQPHHAVGWWLMAAGLSFPLEGFLYEFTQHGMNRWGAIPVVVFASWVVRWVWLISSINIPFTLLLYPNGHLPSSRWRPVLWFMWTLAGLAFMLMALDPEPMGDLGGLPNPIGVAALEGTIEMVSQMVLNALAVLPLLAALSLVARYRGATTLEKQQIKLLGWVAAVSVVFFTLLGFADFSELVYVMLNIGYTLFVAGFITAGIIRYRLFDIDSLVSRTVSYSVVVAVLVGVYAAVVTFLTQVLPFQSNLSVAASTVAVAALFNPLRRHIQRWVDRRFNRLRYDAEATVGSFTEQLRNEVDMAGVSDELVSAVRRTMEPEFMSLWLSAEPSGASSENITRSRNAVGTGTG